MTLGLTPPRRRALAAALIVAIWLAAAASGADEPRYDVPSGFRRCPHAIAWNGFFKWASVRRTTCHHAATFMRAYARAAEKGPMPHRVKGFRCRIRYWKNADREVYASRHRCLRRRVIIRFYGMA